MQFIWGRQVRVDVIHFKRLCSKRKEHLTKNEIIASRCVILEKSFKFTSFYQLATTLLLEYLHKYCEHWLKVYH